MNLPLFRLSMLVAACCAAPAPWSATAGQRPAVDGAAWTRHTIDASSRGADGVRLADFNGDGRPDLVTGWEEGGRVRVCLHPGPAACRQPWPAVTVGRVAAPEDAVAADLDGDGRLDVVSSCEGHERTMYVHWGPAAEQLPAAAAWQTAAFPETGQKQSWMFSLPLDVDRRHGIDVVTGSKGKGAAVGWLESPADARCLADWRWHPLAEAGWIMSLLSGDVDGDGDLDVVFSDRRGPRAGCWWLERPADVRRPWPRHLLGAAGREVMFLTLADLDGDRREELIVAVKGGGLICLQRRGDATAPWTEISIPMPRKAGTGKAVAAGDLTGDGRAELVVSCEHAAEKWGLFALQRTDHDGPLAEAKWQPRDIAGQRGTKFDLVQLLDVDGDGDLDVVTCEERENLGVVWFENQSPVASRQ